MRVRTVATHIAIAVALAATVGCHDAVDAWISTDPLGAKLAVNGKPEDVSPRKYTFDYKGDIHTYEVKATLDGYFDAATTVTEDSPEMKAKEVKLTLIPNKAYSETVPSPSADNKVILIQTDPKLTGDDVLKLLVRDMTDRYSSLLPVDSRAGNLQSEWYVRDFPGPSANKTITVRIRAVAVINSAAPLVYKVTLVSQSTTEGASAPADHWTDFGRVFKADIDMIAKLKADIGVKQPGAE